MPPNAQAEKLPVYVRVILTELRRYGLPDADGYQGKVEIRLDDIAVPVIGFVDWRFSAHGLIVDLKTTERLPSAIGASHGRQGAVYATAHGNFGMRFAYAKPAPAKGDGRQVQVLEMSGDDVRAHLAALRLRRKGDGPLRRSNRPRGRAAEASGRSGTHAITGAVGDADATAVAANDVVGELLYA